MASFALAVPFRVDGAGRIARESDIAGQVESRLIGLIGSGRGERVMRPGYGAGAMNWVFDVNDPLQETVFAGQIRDAISNYEPAVVVDAVTPQSQDPAGGQMQLNIQYHFVTTGDAYSTTVKVGATATYGWPEVPSG